MRRTKKALLVLAGLLFFLMTAAAVISTIEISPPRLEAALMVRAGEIMEMPVSSGGISVRLNRGLTIRNISIGEPGSEILSAERITVSANFLHLLRRSIDVKNIIIEKPVIKLGEDGFLMPLVLPAESEDPGTGFQFRLRAAEIKSGRLTALRGEETIILADGISITVSSIENNLPISLSAEADILGEIRLEASGEITSAREPYFEINSSLTADWESVGSAAAAAAGFPAAESIGGRGSSIFGIFLSGRPDSIRIQLSGDMTEEEISFADSFLKPAGTPASVSAEALLSHPELRVEKASLALGESVFDITGNLSYEPFFASMEAAGALNLGDAAAFVPAAAAVEPAGAAAIGISLDKGKDAPFSASGTCVIDDWQFSAVGGDSLSFEFTASEERVNIKNVRGRIGEGHLTGSGLIKPGGEYEFTIEGIDIELEDLLRPQDNDEAAFSATGSAGMAASIRSSGAGIERMNGRGNFQAVNGTLKSFPRAERFLDAANFSGLTPLEYDQLRADFMMGNGILNADVFLRSNKIELRAENAELDFIRMEKQIIADLLLSPSFIAGARRKLGDMERLLYFDERGYAHIGLVWDGDIADPRPNMAASLIRTGQKRLREMLRQ